MFKKSKTQSKMLKHDEMFVCISWAKSSKNSKYTDTCIYLIPDKNLACSIIHCLKELLTLVHQCFWIYKKIQQDIILLQNSTFLTNGFKLYSVATEIVIMILTGVYVLLHNEIAIQSVNAANSQEMVKKNPPDCALVEIFTCVNSVIPTVMM